MLHCVQFHSDKHSPNQMLTCIARTSVYNFLSNGLYAALFHCTLLGISTFLSIFIQMAFIFVFIAECWKWLYRNKFMCCPSYWINHYSTFLMFNQGTIHNCGCFENCNIIVLLFNLSFYIKIIMLILTLT